MTCSSQALGSLVTAFAQPTASMAVSVMIRKLAVWSKRTRYDKPVKLELAHCKASNWNIRIKYDNHNLQRKEVASLTSVIESQSLSMANSQHDSMIPSRINGIRILLLMIVQHLTKLHQPINLDIPALYLLELCNRSWKLLAIRSIQLPRDLEILGQSLGSGLRSFRALPTLNSVQAAKGSILAF